MGDFQTLPQYLVSLKRDTFLLPLGIETIYNTTVRKSPLG